MFPNVLCCRLFFPIHTHLLAKALCNIDFYCCFPFYHEAKNSRFIRLAKGINLWNKIFSQLWTFSNRLFSIHLTCIHSCKMEREKERHLCSMEWKNFLGFYFMCIKDSCDFIVYFIFLCSLFSWGLPLLMLSVAAAFIYKERDARISSSTANKIAEDVNTSDIHCW